VTRTSVVIPVKDGARYLEELLAALARERPDEVLVLDSGSTDRSVEIARAAGVELIEIEPAKFGHGRTRNLGAERTTGELICFLTQDATPCSGWLEAYREAFSLDPRVGAGYGPHLPRPDTSPMIARELEEFFASFSPNGQPQLQRPGDPTFLSNVNACYARACWQEIRFRDAAYAEDQAFGVDLFAAGWTKVYQPKAAVLHAHDYGFADFMRRYFDEYRGLRASTGHVERLDVRHLLGYVRGSVAADRRWLAEHDVQGAEMARWLIRSAAHHGGRRLFSAAGSRAGQLPPRLRRALSLESRVDALAAAEAPAAASLAPTVHVGPRLGGEDYSIPVRVQREGPVPLLDPRPGLAEREHLRIAMLVPPFSKGSGGHNTLFQIFSRLEARGHACSVWMHDYDARHPTWSAVRRHDIREFFAPIQAPVYDDFRAWHGTDVIMATGWQTAHPALSLERAYARVYLVNDHEPDFFGASAERLIAADTYRHGMHCIAASPWLRDLLIERYGASADAFQLGVDHSVYYPRRIGRRRDTIVYYVRPATPRRAVPIGLIALEELHRRRPELRVILFGTRDTVHTPFPHEQAGILNPEELAWLYSHATVGLCLSLTNFSLMPKEMLACGLPCVELAGVSAESIFGENGPIELAPLDPSRLADAIERLLDDEALWEERSRAGVEFVADHTWDRATDQVEAGLRRALAMRERRSASHV
jgi:glycosyltransferase involved in cell wall biosynthesis